MLRQSKKPCCDLFHPNAHKSQWPAHVEEGDIVWNQPQSKIKILGFVVLFCISDWKFSKEIAWPRWANPSVILCIPAITEGKIQYEKMILFVSCTL